MTNPADYQQTAAKALALCAAHDPWFPKPSEAVVYAWAERIAEYKLAEADVLEGVRLAYRDNGAGFKPLPADIVKRAREARRDRGERETDAERRAREDRRDAELEANRRRLGALVEGIAETKAVGRA